MPLRCLPRQPVNWAIIMWGPNIFWWDFCWKRREWQPEDANGVKADKVKELISQLIFPNQNVGTIGETVYTPGAVRVLNQSYREAVRFKAPLIGTEHLLIAMIRESDCAAVRLLNTMDVSLQKLYVDLRSAMGEDGADAREELQSSRAGKDLKQLQP